MNADREMNTGVWPAAGCPTEQVLLDLTLGSLAPESQRRASEHIGRCEVCAESVAAAVPFLVTQTPRPAAADAQASEPETPLAEPVTSRRSLKSGQILRHTYEIVRFIGRGAMGEVYEATHARLVGRYAIKILNLDLAGIALARARFRREAIASELRHPNIVQVIDFDETDEGRPYLVLEFLEGQDLGAILAATGALPLERTLALALQIAAGLAAMHRSAIVHRDLKPANVVVLPAAGGEPERIKLVDFGLSRRQVPSLAVTQTRTLLGTPQYMAPEQARGDTDAVGPAADQFAMAALLYEMLSGRPAFNGESLAVVLYQIVHATPTPLQKLVPGLPIPVLSAIERALNKDPERRFPSVRDFVDALTLARDGGQERAASISATAERSAPARRPMRAAALAGLAAAAIATALWLRPTIRPARRSLAPVAQPMLPSAATPPTPPSSAPTGMRASMTLHAIVDEPPRPVPTDQRQRTKGHRARAERQARQPSPPPAPVPPPESQPAAQANLEPVAAPVPQDVSVAPSLPTSIEQRATVKVRKGPKVTHF